MANVFDIGRLSGTIAAAKDKAVALAGEYGLNDALGGRILPPLPPFPTGREIDIEQAGGFSDVENIQTDYEDQQRFSILGTPMVFPIELKRTNAKENEWWLLPLEPIISISGGNTIIRRNVAKGTGRGSVKERWNSNDYTINITGMLKLYDEYNYPADYVSKLRKILEARETIDVKCKLFEIFDIERIAVESFDFPFTKSEENQAYTITAYSDDNWDLLIDTTQLKTLKPA